MASDVGDDIIEAKDGRLGKVWAVVLPNGEQRPIRDVDFDVLASVAKTSKVDELASLVDNPFAHGYTVADRLYRAACKAADLKPVKADSIGEAKARFTLIDAEVPADPLGELVEEVFRELDDGSGDVAPEAFWPVYNERRQAWQWAVVLPDGTTRKLWDLEWALLETIADRHGETTVDQILDRPRGGNGALIADLWRSITENQRQPATTAGMTYAEVIDVFRLVGNDRPTLDDFDETGLPDPEADGPETV